MHCRRWVYSGSRIGVCFAYWSRTRRVLISVRCLLSIRFKEMHPRLGSFEWIVVLFIHFKKKLSKILPSFRRKVGLIINW